MTVNFVHESILKNWKIALSSYLIMLDTYCKWKFIRQFKFTCSCYMYNVHVNANYIG